MTEQALTAFQTPGGRAAVPPASPAARALLPAAADGVELVAKFFRALGDPALGQADVLHALRHGVLGGQQELQQP